MPDWMEACCGGCLVLVAPLLAVRRDFKRFDVSNAPASRLPPPFHLGCLLVGPLSCERGFGTHQGTGVCVCSWTSRLELPA